MKVYQTIRLYTFHSPAHTFQYTTIKRNIIQINPVNIIITYHPGKSFDVVIIPTRITFCCQNRSIGSNPQLICIFKMLIPLWCIICHKMFTAPRKPSSLTVFQNFMSQTPYSPYLSSRITQFTKCIINFHLASLLMPFFCEILYFTSGQERIINKRIILVSLMHINNAYASFQIFSLWSWFRAVVIITVCKLPVKMNGFHRSNNHSKIKMNGFLRFQSPATTICGNLHFSRLLSDGESSFPTIIPAFRICRTIQIQ